MPAWWVYAIWAATTVISYLTRPKVPGPEAATRDDLEIPHIEEGRSFNGVFGTVLITDPTVAAVGDFDRVPVKSRSGKK